LIVKLTGAQYPELNDGDAHVVIRARGVSSGIT
jgi:hypothetical protein